MGFIRGNRRRASMCVLSLLVCVVAAISNVSIATSSSTTAEGQELDQHLAVVVPSHRGDLSRTVASLSRWPTYCSPVTQKYVDLILYYAEGENDDAVDAALHTIAASAGQCFANTRVVFANLKEEVRQCFQQKYWQYISKKSSRWIIIEFKCNERRTKNNRLLIVNGSSGWILIIAIRFNQFMELLGSANSLGSPVREWKANRCDWGLFNSLSIYLIHQTVYLFLMTPARGHNSWSPCC